METADLRGLRDAALRLERAGHTARYESGEGCPICLILAHLPALLAVVEAAEKRSGLPYLCARCDQGNARADAELDAALKALAAAAPPAGDD